MNLVELTCKLQTLAHEGFALAEVDDIAGHEIMDVKIVGDRFPKVIFITQKKD